MGNSIEKPENFKIVCGEMAYDGKTKNIECPPSTVKNVKMLPRYRVPMQEGELAIKVEESICQIDNGKIINLEERKAQRTQKEYEEAR